MSQPQAFGFESKSPTFVLEYPQKKGTSREIRFVAHEFFTDNEDVAAFLTSHPLFGSEPGQKDFWKYEVSQQRPAFERPRQKTVAVSGGRGTRN